jgi:hypothetical protein
VLTTSDIMGGKIVCQLGLAQPSEVQQVLREVDWDPSAAQDLLNRLVARGLIPADQVPTVRHRVGLYEHVRREALYLRMLERKSKIPKTVVAQLISELERTAYRRRLGDVLTRTGKLSLEQDHLLQQRVQEWVGKDDARIMERYRTSDFEGVGRPLIPNSTLDPADFKISALFRSRETRALVEKSALERLRAETAETLIESTGTLPPVSELVRDLPTPAPVSPDDDTSDEDEAQATFRAQPDANGGLSMQEVLSLKRISDYAIVETLGTGGMGAVFLAQKDGAGEFVAIKVLLTAAASELEKGRFRREIDLNRRIEHPNVIHIIDSGVTEQGLDYLIVPALAGKELRDYLDAAGGEGLQPELVLRVAEQMLAGMQAVHEQGIVHRDMKPENVFVLAGGNHDVKIMDFGLAKLGDADITDLNSFRSGTTEACGSPAYIAPESVTNDDIDPRTDIYSLGVMLFELLTGKLPLESETSQGYLTQHMISPPLTLKEARPERDWPQPLEDLIERMLGKSLDERPESCAAVWQELAGMREAVLASAQTTGEAEGAPSAAPDPEKTGEFGFKGLLGRLWGRS